MRTTRNERRNKPRDVGAGFTAKDIPAVARWDLNPDDMTQFIGIRCRNDWCEVHAKSAFKTSARHAAAGGANTAEARRVSVVKGWYDEQYLADFAQNGKPIPGKVIGTVFPTSDLESQTVATYANNVWVPVAYTTLSALSTTYHDKYNYGVARNDVSLCMGGPAECHVSPATDLKLTTCTTGWFAKISSDGTDRYFCTKFRGFKGTFGIPGVVRWRWRANDDTIWIRCPSGCCEIDAT